VCSSDLWLVLDALDGLIDREERLKSEEVKRVFAFDRTLNAPTILKMPISARRSRLRLALTVRMF
jgi:hypothetical protein